MTDKPVLSPIYLNKASLHFNHYHFFHKAMSTFSLFFKPHRQIILNDQVSPQYSLTVSQLLSHWYTSGRPER